MLVVEIVGLLVVVLLVARWLDEFEHNLDEGPSYGRCPRVYDHSVEEVWGEIADREIARG